ncbi:MAG: LCP family protein, partial [Hungatella sp.]
MEYHDELERMRARKQRKEPVSKLESKLDIVDLEHVDYTALDKKDINIQKKRLAKRKRKKRILTIEFLVLIILVVCIGAFFKKHNSGYWTIAIFGVDSRDGNLEKGALSDVEMLCVIDRKTGEMKLVSVFRDTYLQISSDGTYHKINEAYFKGGHKQAVSALERNLDLKIDDYATFNWKAVADTINILGGIDLEISNSEFKYINSFITETVESTGIGSVHLKKAGMNHLDGVQA